MTHAAVKPLVRAAMAPPGRGDGQSGGEHATRDEPGVPPDEADEPERRRRQHQRARDGRGGDPSERGAQHEVQTRTQRDGLKNERDPRPGTSDLVCLPPPQGRQQRPVIVQQPSANHSERAERVEVQAARPVREDDREGHQSEQAVATDAIATRTREPAALACIAVEQLARRSRRRLA